MNVERFESITRQYAGIRIAVVGDFCLDRYLEIDPAKAETSIETGLPVYNVTNLRAQPGGAGTVLSNLSALGAGAIFPVGFAGYDGEGYELGRALGARRGVQLDGFIQTDERRTFTYCKPLIVEPGQPPRELNRLDQKNWTPTPAAVSQRLCEALSSVANRVDAFILIGQVEEPQTGVLTAGVLKTFDGLAQTPAGRVMLADDRRGLEGYPSVILKMNALELAALTGLQPGANPAQVAAVAVPLARRTGRPVFVTLAECGIVGASPEGESEHVSAWPLRGAIDIVGAGDAVSANLTMALAAGASLREALELANAAASIVVHQLGTTGSASVSQLRELIFAQ